MKKTIFPFLLPALLLLMGNAQRDRQTFQVISSHPHDLAELEGHVETVHKEGRLWIVDLKDNPPLHVFEHLRPTSGLEKSYRYERRGIRKRTLSARQLEIRARVKEIDPEAIRKDVEDLAHYTTRAAGTDENREAVGGAAQRLRDLGFSVKEVCYRDGVCSIVADKHGKVKPQEVLLVLAHIDSVGKQFAGADDNASGTAVLLEMARVLSTFDNKKTIRFFITNGEELGLLGAEHYVELLKKSGEVKKISLAVNMDMVGYNKNGIVELETNPELEDLAKWYAELASQYTKLKTKITLGAWGSDHVPFLKAGVPAILTIEDWSTKTPCYHMACDLPGTLNYDYAADIGRLNLAAIMARDLL